MTIQTYFEEDYFCKRVPPTKEDMLAAYEHYNNGRDFLEGVAKDFRLKFATTFYLRLINAKVSFTNENAKEFVQQVEQTKETLSPPMVQKIPKDSDDVLLNFDVDINRIVTKAPVEVGFKIDALSW